MMKTVGHSKFQMGTVFGMFVMLALGALVAALTPKEALEMCEGAVRELTGGRR